MRSFRLPHHAGQTGFAVAAIAAAVALPVVLLSVGGGVSQHELDSLQHAGFEVEVSAAGLHGVEGAHALADRIDRVPDVTAASPILSVAVDVFATSGGPVPTLAEGVIPKAFTQAESPSERALFPAVLPLGDPTDRTHFANGTYSGASSGDVLVPLPFAAELDVSVGSTIYLAATTDRASAVPFTVTGIAGAAAASLGPSPTNTLVLALSDLQLVAGLALTNGTSGTLLDATDSVQIVLGGAASTDPAAVDRVAQAVQALVPYYSVSTLGDQVRSAHEASAVLTGFYLALSSVGLSVGLVFLGLVLVRRVETERRTIGLLRALGVPGRQVARQMAGRGLLLGGLGAIGGVVTGWVVVRLFALYGSPSVRLAVSYAVFDPVTLAWLVLGVIGLSIVASLGATRAAVRLSIPEALR